MSSHQDNDSGGLPVWWLLLLAFVIVMLTALATASVVLMAERNHPLVKPVAPAVLAIAETPVTLNAMVEMGLDPTRDLRVGGRLGSKRFEGAGGFDYQDAPGDWDAAPYLLLNRYDADAVRSVSELVDLRSQEILHRWEFDTDPIWRGLEFESVFVDPAGDGHTGRFRNIHADLAPDGSLVTHSDASPLLKFDLCGQLEWVNADDAFHHSVERDADGFYWVPVHLEPTRVEFGSALFKDSGLARLTPEGEVTYLRSVANIMEDNGLAVYTRGQGQLDDDPIHLNDIQPVFEDGALWKKGDLWLSIRNRSMVMLYRPETDEVIWWHIGPWIHQHDVNIIDDRQITVFDNAAKRFGFNSIRPETANGVWIVDVVDNRFTPVYPEGFEALELRTRTEGRSRLLADGPLFVEESNFGRVVIMDPDGTARVSYVNRAGDGQLYRLNWSRIVDRETGDAVRALLEGGACE